MRAPAAALLFVLAGAADAADCTRLSRVCVEGPETRVFEGLEVYRECWRYQSEYECLGGGLQEDTHCAELRAQGCAQTGSRCITYIEGICVTYEQIYECSSPLPADTREVMDCGGQLFCLEGDCFDAGYAPNSGFGEAAAHLSVMQATADDLAVDHLEIFKGQDHRCGVSVFSGAHNCCALSGWAKQGVLECSFEEELLAELRNAERCHYVGSYCSNRTARTCTVTKQSHCCFSSKLARIIAEQGRIQFGRGWGSAQSPDCGGFSPEEVAQLDFEAMDLSEFYADVMASAPEADQEELRDRLTDRIHQLLP